jgi:hypothetical protein
MDVSFIDGRFTSSVHPPPILRPSSAHPPPILRPSSAHPSPIPCPFSTHPLPPLPPLPILHPSRPLTHPPLIIHSSATHLPIVPSCALLCTPSCALLCTLSCALLCTPSCALLHPPAPYCARLCPPVSACACILCLWRMGGGWTEDGRRMDGGCKSPIYETHVHG